MPEAQVCVYIFIQNYKQIRTHTNSCVFKKLFGELENKNIDFKLLNFSSFVTKIKRKLSCSSHLLFLFIKSKLLTVFLCYFVKYCGTGKLHRYAALPSLQNIILTLFDTFIPQRRANLFLFCMYVCLCM